MFIKVGAYRLLLEGERQRFLAEQWPTVYATIQRLGLSPEEVLEKHRSGGHLGGRHDEQTVLADHDAIAAQGVLHADHLPWRPVILLATMALISLVLTSGAVSRSSILLRGACRLG